MKTQKFLTYAVLVIMFCVAVSGGCGGGSSSNFSGNYAITSNDVTPEPDEQPDEQPTSDDVNPVPDNPTSDDEYGGNNGWEELNSLSNLNGTEWTIDEVEVHYDNYLNYGKILSSEPNSYNYNFNKFTLITSDTSLVWREGNNYHADALTINFTDVHGIQRKAPILRTAIGFSYIEPDSNDEEPDENEYYRAQLPERSKMGYFNVEYIELTSKNFNPQELVIANDFYFEELPYSSIIKLKRVK